MNKDPRSYRVPVLRLTDVYSKAGAQDDEVQDDLIEPRPKEASTQAFKEPFVDDLEEASQPSLMRVQSTAPPEPIAKRYEPVERFEQNEVKTPETKIMQPRPVINIVPEPSLHRDEPLPKKVVAPIFTRNIENDESGITEPTSVANEPAQETPAPILQKPQEPKPTTQRELPRTPLPKRINPWEKPQEPDPLDIWERAALKKKTHYPTKPPIVQEQPVVATTTENASFVEKLKAEELSSSQYAQSEQLLVQKNEVALSGETKQTTEETERSYLNKALIGMSIGPHSKPVDVEGIEPTNSQLAELDVKKDLIDIDVETSRNQKSVAQPVAEVPLEPAPDSGNLAALRERVLRAGMSHKHDVAHDTDSDGLAKVRAKSLTRVDLRNAKDAHDMVKESFEPAELSVTETRPTTLQEKHAPSTTHAKAIAGVAEALHAIQNEEQDLPIVQVNTLEDIQTNRPEGVAEQTPVRHGVPMMRTFKSDVERTINHNKVSVVKMISDQEKHRHATSDVSVRHTKNKHFSIPSSLLVVVSMLLIIGAIVFGVIVATTMLRSDQSDTVNALFFADKSVPYDATGQDRTALLQGIMRMRDTGDLNFGQVLEIVPFENITLTGVETSQTRSLSGQEFLKRINARVPDTLMRTVQDSFIIGVHSITERNPFIVFRVGYYENAFQGMLLWEEAMDVDLSPLFGVPITNQVTAPKAPEPALGTSTATTTDASLTPISVAQYADSRTVDTRTLGTFADVSYSNITARALKNKLGEIQIVWAIPDSSTIMITTSVDTLLEIAKRMQAR